MGVTLASAPQDVDKVFQQADKLFEDTKAAYEAAKEKNSLEGFVAAGFTLEEAKTKYIALQEFAEGEKKKLAGERLRQANQLAKLINDGRKAASGKPAEDPPKNPVEPAPPAKPNDPEPPPAAKPVAGSPTGKSVRVPVPDAAKLRESEKSIKEIFKADYAKKQPADRLALSRTLLREAASQEDPAARWFLLRESQDIAAQQGELETVSEAIDAMAKSFDCEPCSLKLSAYSTAIKVLKAPEDLSLLADRHSKLAEEAVAADLYDVADKAASTALQLAKKANDLPLAGRIATRSKEVSEIKTRFEKSKKARETLARVPDDALSNFELGHFLCVIKGNWESGLPMLVRGSDATYRAVAARDIATPEAALDQVVIGDGWWDLGEKESGLAKAALQRRAAIYYEQALGRVQGLVKTRIEKRLNDADQAQAGGINLLRMIDLKVDSISGQWKMESGALSCAPSSAARVQIPYQPPDEYDLTMTLSHGADIDIVHVIFVAGGIQVGFMFDWQAKSGGISGLDHPPTLSGSDLGVKGTVFFPATGPHTTVLSVRKKGLTITVDGKKAFSWQGDFKKLGINPDWKVPEANSLSVGAWNMPTSFTRLTLTPISGQGKRLR
jgi:hypothetical protein